MSRKHKARHRDTKARRGEFGDETPWKNPFAVFAYRSSVIGLIPLAGLICGPVAILSGLLALRRFRRNSAIRGQTQARAAIVLGALEAAFNFGGVACIWVGIAR